MNDKSESLLDLLLRLDACGDALTWAVTQPDLRTAWAVCQRADWMLWLAAMLLPRQVVVLAACDCAETAVHLISDGGLQMNALLALHIAREWAQGRECLETVRAASDSVSYAASYDATSAGAAVRSAVAAAVAAASYAAVAVSAGPSLPLRWYAAAVAAAYASHASHAADCDSQAALSHMTDLVRTCISADMICAAMP